MRILLVTAICCLAFPFPSMALKNLIIINNEPVRNAPTQQLISASPYYDEVLVSPPKNVTLTFAMPLHPGKSNIRVFDMYGTQLNDGIVTPNDKSISVMLPLLGPGKYKVKWKAQCLCEEETELDGDYRFTVR